MFLQQSSCAPPTPNHLNVFFSSTWTPLMFPLHPRRTQDAVGAESMVSAQCIQSYITKWIVFFGNPRHRISKERHFLDKFAPLNFSFLTPNVTLHCSATGQGQTFLEGNLSHTLNGQMHLGSTFMLNNTFCRMAHWAFRELLWEPSTQGPSHSPRKPRVSWGNIWAVSITRAVTTDLLTGKLESAPVWEGSQPARWWL